MVLPGLQHIHTADLVTQAGSNSNQLVLGLALIHGPSEISIDVRILDQPLQFTPTHGSLAMKGRRRCLEATAGSFLEMAGAAAILRGSGKNPDIPRLPTSDQAATFHHRGAWTGTHQVGNLCCGEGCCWFERSREVGPFVAF